ncbi:MAG: glucodextranase DOMON-like domain-containing protein [Bacillota bacterium]|nr:glucodextranase DOMON-like domain-containing protein [Bacillota bacterium]
MRQRLSSVVFIALIVFLAISGAQGAETPVVSLADPAGDDYGPGTYVYPTNSVFSPGAFDIAKFEVYKEADEARFEITLAESIANPWGGPNGISVQMFQIYVDSERSSGFAECIPGANVAFADDSRWDKAIICEGGWGTEVEDIMAGLVDDDMRSCIHVAKKASVTGRTIRIWVPVSWLGTPSPGWGYQVLLMGQEGSKDVMDGIKVRRVLRERTEWQFGGSDESGYHPNVLDMLTEPGADQKAILGSYSKEKDTFAIVSHVYR